MVGSDVLLALVELCVASAGWCETGLLSFSVYYKPRVTVGVASSGAHNRKEEVWGDAGWLDRTVVLLCTLSFALSLSLSAS